MAAQKIYARKKHLTKDFTISFRTLLKVMSIIFYLEASRYLTRVTNDTSRVCG